jgi:cytochrome c2
VSVRPRLALRALPVLLLGAAACAGTATPAATPTTAPVEVGRALFRNKGCVTCHRNNRVEGKTGTLDIGPDLTHYQNEAGFLRAWLADPAAVKPNTRMPDLRLTEGEIEDLIAFLNAGE